MKRNKQKGVTLVELVVTITLLSVILIAALSATDFGQKSFTAINNRGSIQTQADNIIATISKQVRASTALPTVTGGTMLTVSGNITFTWNSGSRTLTYAVAGVTRTVYSDVSAVSFTLPDNSINGSNRGIKITITLTSGTQSYTCKTTVYNRMA